jgi:hypothetical protein
MLYAIYKFYGITIHVRKIYKILKHIAFLVSMSKGEKNPVDHDVEKMWMEYSQTNEMEIRKNLLNLFYDTKREIGTQYIKTVGESLDKVAPNHLKEKDSRIRFFWDTANEWDPKIEKNVKDHLGNMKRIFD